MEEEKSVRLKLALRFLSFTYYPLRQGTGLTCSFHFVVTHNNWSNNPTAFAFPQQAEQMTTRARVIQYAHCTQKNKWKKTHSVQNFFFYFGEHNRGWRSVGIFGDFFLSFFQRCCLPPTRCGHAFWVRQARPPACIVAGSFGARRGALRGRPSLQHVPASLFGNGRPGPERRSGRGQSQAQLTDTHTPTSSHSHTATRLLHFFTQTLLVFPPPILPPSTSSLPAGVWNHSLIWPFFSGRTAFRVPQAWRHHWLPRWIAQVNPWLCLSIC